ncbi:preprotein translocase subunit YajC [Azospirillum griseum]|uniref:Sec translocon accessory complex subunit YajC n=1 Tax=Azospirillum griseum TaxID=2496639 RepID=A0A3S0KZD9_9PROT|nr:preprotein translocase subunit YajC [Azospirillum griseum]RTR21553.1 preprotein translocase subunit YajC [Azospirillum griseum]
MFVSTAYAQTAAPAAGGDMIVQFLPLILIFVVFYFLLIRPQQKKMKEHKAMLSAIRRGDRVVTGGGIIGVVTKVGADDEVSVEIAENVRVRCLRSTINLVLAKTEPANGKPGDTAAPEEAKTEDAPAAGGVLGKLLGRK